MKHLQIFVFFILITFLLAMSYYASIHFETCLGNEGNIDVVDLNKNNIKYNICNKKIFVFSVECEKCIEDLSWLAGQSYDRQKQVDLISISEYDDSVELIERLNVISQTYIDVNKKFKIKYRISGTPTAFEFDEQKAIEVDEGLKGIIN